VRNPQCVIYAAKSTEDRHGSIGTQLADCCALAAKEGWDVAAEFHDEGFSAYHGNRGPDLEAARQAATDLAADGAETFLIAQHSDRFARGAGDAPGAAQHLAEVLFWARRQGVTLRSVEDDFTFSHPLLAFAMGERNAEDSKRKARSVKAGMKRRAAQRGLLPGGPRPYGYRWEGPKGEKRLVIVEAEAAVVARMFRAYAAGTSGWSIARELNSDGVTTTNGRQWYQGTVANVLRNPIYKGYVRNNGEIYPGVHEPIVPEALWEDVARIREGSARTRGNGGGRYSHGRHLFTKGLLRCGQCGEAMIPRTNPSQATTPGNVCQYPPITPDEYAEACRLIDDEDMSIGAAARAIGRSDAGLRGVLKRGGPTGVGRHEETYVCYGRVRNGPDFCSQQPVPRPEVDTATFAWFERKDLDVDTMRERIEATVKAKVGETQVLREQAEREAQRAAVRLSRVKRDYMDGKLGAEDWAMFREELNTEADAAIGQAQQLAQREDELGKSLRSATEDQVARELGELRAAIAGHIEAAEGLDGIRFRLRRLFQTFTLKATESGMYLQAELASGVMTTLNVQRLRRFMDEWHPRAGIQETDVKALPT
jgi:DNA invertase Pin-like site-specific DNA recombinase